MKIRKPTTQLVRRTVVGVTVFALLSGCATSTGVPDFMRPLEEAFFSQDPCSNNARNWGIALGALAGGLIGHKAGDGKAGGVLVGAAVGGGIGALIGADMDRKRCELQKIADQYGLQMQVEQIKATSDPLPSAAPGGSVSAPSAGGSPGAPQGGATIGLSVSVSDAQGNIGHFEVDSDRLTPRAREYFSAIAAHYNPRTVAESIPDPKQRAEYLSQARQRRLLLVGHTDDTGSSSYNAELSERRAQSVARLLVERGVAPDWLYYQGAGESYPIAENHTDAGRARNRRVEIVEVVDEGGFKRFLDLRRPRYEYYRPIPPAKSRPGAPPPATVPAPPPTGPSAPTPKRALPALKPTVPGPGITPSLPAPAPPSVARPGAPEPPVNPAAPAVRASGDIDFGGARLSARGAGFDLGKALRERGGFSFVSEAYADDSEVLLTSCLNDRPRVAGSVKSLSSGKTYATSEHLPGLYGRSWFDVVNGHLVVLNKVAVLRDSASPANSPELKVYRNYNAAHARTAQPDLHRLSDVNIYRGSKGVLYRVFAQGESGLQCLDVLFANDGQPAARDGHVIYFKRGEAYAADFQPRINQ